MCFFCALILFLAIAPLQRFLLYKNIKYALEKMTTYLMMDDQCGIWPRNNTPQRAEKTTVK